MVLPVASITIEEIILELYRGHECTPCMDIDIVQFSSIVFWRIKFLAFYGATSIEVKCDKLASVSSNTPVTYAVRKEYSFLLDHVKREL